MISKDLYICTYKQDIFKNGQRKLYNPNREFGKGIISCITAEKILKKRFLKLKSKAEKINLKINGLR